MAGLIPQLVIDEILIQTDLVQLIDSYWPLKKHGVNFTACCPFHHEKTPSFNVIPKKQFYYCFGCGASGNAISFLMQHQQLGFVAAVDVLATRLGLTIPQDSKAPTHHNKKKSVDGYALLQQVNLYYRQFLQNEGRGATEYLNKRGVTAEIIEKFELGYAAKDWHHLENRFKTHQSLLLETGMIIKNEDGRTFDRYRHRLMFPIHDRQGRVVGFGGRALEQDQQPKYMNSPETPFFHKSRELYGLYQLLQYKNYSGPIVVVEGYMDVISLVQHGIYYAVATLGTSTTMHHLQLLTKYTKQVIFCFDGDEAGKKAAWRALENSLPMMDGQVDVKFMFLPQSEDPDSYVRKYGPDEFINLMSQSKAWHEFWLGTLTGSIPMDTLSGKSQLIQAALPFLNQVPEGTYKDLLLNQLSRMTRLEPDRISQRMKKKPSQEISPPARSAQITRSPLRLAIALLLQFPERMVEKLPQLILEQEDEPGMEVLRTLLSYLQQRPQANTAMLIEQWRDTAWFDPLQKLSTWDHQVPEALIDQELAELIQHLNKQTFEKKINAYMNKSRTEGLSLTEQAELQALLKRRHQII